VLLPYTPASVAAARLSLTAELAGQGIFQTAISDAVLVVSELLSNAIRHASPLPGAVVQVTWELERGSLEISVRDGGGPTSPRPAHSSLSSLGGRGLEIVERLAYRWGTSTSDTGTVVWALLPAPHAGDRDVMTGSVRP
jgi:anti-sigma regulatory factor (Ser/Thr protein kinase)